MSTPGLGWLTWLAMLLVLLAAALLSFSALRDLAELCGVDPLLAPLLPICVDAGAAVSARVWLSGRAVVAERFARAMTLVLLAVTVCANAVHSALVASGVPATWQLAVAVGAIPPAVVGAVVHLAALVGRPVQDGGELVPTPAPGTRQVQVDEVTDVGHLDRAETGAALDAEKGGDTLASTPPRFAAPGSVDERAGLDPVRLDELIADGAGRRRIARELDIPEHRARALVESRRNGHGPAEVAQ